MYKKIIFNVVKNFFDLFVYFIDSIYFLIKSNNKKPKNIITIVRVDAIGDFIIYVSSHNLIPKKFLEYKKVLICNELVFDLAKSLNIFDEIIPINLKSFKSNLIYRIRLLSKLSSLQSKVVLHPTFSRCFKTGDSIVRFLPSFNKIAFKGDFINQNKFFRKISDKWYDKLIEADKYIKMEMERNHEFFEKISQEEVDFKKFKPPNFSNFCFFKNSEKKYIIIAPGASSSIKCWPPSKFKDLINQIILKYKIDVVLCGTKSEKTIIQNITYGLNSRVVHISIENTLLEFIEIVRGAELLIGNDSSPIHIANFVNTKSICLYGGRIPGRFLPYPDRIQNPPLVASNKKCKKLNWECAETHNCLAQIQVEDVMEMILKI